MDYLKPISVRGGSNERSENLFGVSMLQKMSTSTSRSMAKCEGASSAGGYKRESSPPGSSQQAQPPDDGTRTVGGASWSNNPPLQSQASTVSKVTSILRVNSFATGAS